MKILITILILIATNNTFASKETIIEYEENISQADYVCQQEINGNYIADNNGDVTCLNENLEIEILYGNDKSQEFDLFNKKNDVRVLYLFPSNGISKISQSNNNKIKIKVRN